MSIEDAEAVGHPPHKEARLQDSAEEASEEDRGGGAGPEAVKGVSGRARHSGCPAFGVMTEDLGLDGLVK